MIVVYIVKIDFTQLLFLADCQDVIVFSCLPWINMPYLEQGTHPLKNLYNGEYNIVHLKMILLFCVFERRLNYPAN